MFCSSSAVWAGLSTMYYGLVRSSHIDAETKIFCTCWTSGRALWIPNLMTTQPKAAALTFSTLVPFTPLLTRRSRFFIDPVCIFFTRFTRTEMGRLVVYTFTIFCEFYCAYKSKLFPFLKQFTSYIVWPTFAQVSISYRVVKVCPKIAIFSFMQPGPGLAEWSNIALLHCLVVAFVPSVIIRALTSASNSASIAVVMVASLGSNQSQSSIEVTWPLSTNQRLYI